MENEFSVGDIVVLRSGGPLMTVLSHIPFGVTMCTYFNERQELCRVELPNEVLAWAELEEDDEEESGEESGEDQEND